MLCVLQSKTAKLLKLRHQQCAHSLITPQNLTKASCESIHAFPAVYYNTLTVMPLLSHTTGPLSSSGVRPPAQPLLHCKGLAARQDSQGPTSWGMSSVHLLDSGCAAGTASARAAPAWHAAARHATRHTTRHALCRTWCTMVLSTR